VAENDGFSTQPEPDKLLDQYRRMHEAEAAGSSIRTRFTSIELRQGLAVEADTPEQQRNAESDDPEQAADPAAADE
jgi:hypothetical protein